MIDSILKTAGQDGCSQTVPVRERWHRLISFLVLSRGRLVEVRVFVGPRRRWERYARDRSWEREEWGFFDVGPFVIAATLAE